MRRLIVPRSLSARKLIRAARPRQQGRVQRPLGGGGRPAAVSRSARRGFLQDIFLICLNDQLNIACLMFIRGVYHPIFQFICIFH